MCRVDTGCVPLKAARAGRVDELQEWLGLDRSGVNSMDSDGYTPFHYAAECHHLDVLRTLVEFGAGRLNIRRSLPAVKYSL